MTSLIVSALRHSYFLAGTAVAQVFNGPGLEGGVIEAGQINGPVKADLRSVILSLMYKALGYLALAGIVMVIIAGFIMVLSSGKDEAKDRAKKIILYVVLGIVIVMFARTIVGFFVLGLP